MELGTQIEAIFERPQDIEWCITDNEIYVVQARPITSLFPVPSSGCARLPEERCSSLSPKPSDDRLHVYVSMGHIQAFAEPMPPLVRDLWMTFIQTMYTEFGFGADTQWAAEAGGRVYIDMTAPLRIGSVRDQLPDQLAATSEPASVGVADILRRRGEDVHDPAEETIKKDEILIAPSSDPGWTPLFLNAAGIVVEVGGRLSHGALVAREYGLPGVVSVAEATQRIETGDHIRIDGDRGTVERLDRSEQSAAVDDLGDSDEEGQ